MARGSQIASGARARSRALGIAIALLSVVAGIAGCSSEPLEDSVLTFVEAHKDGVAGVEGLRGATSIAISPDGQHLYVTGWASNAVAAFARDAATGALTFIETQTDGLQDVDGLEGPSAMVASPDGKHLYVTTFEASVVVVFSRNAETGVLTFVEAERVDQAGADGLLGASSVAISPDGKHLYAASLWNGTIAVFTRDSTTGALDVVDVQRDRGVSIGGFGLSAATIAISPGGRYVYAVSVLDRAVAVFSRDVTTGALTFVNAGRGGADRLGGPASVAISPDGKNLYVTDSSFSTVDAFNRDPATGGLSFVGAQTDGVAGVDGLFRVASAAVSPDGTYVYTASDNGNAVAVFSRNTTTGSLTFVEVHKDGRGGVDGLEGARWVTVSPDGKNVYVAGAEDHSIVVFRVIDPPIQ